MSVKLLISPLYLNEILAGYSNLGCRLFSFITLTMCCHSLLAWRVYIDRLDVILIGIHLCVICCFSLVAFNICSLIFVNLINMCLGVFHLGFILFGTLWVSWSPVFLCIFSLVVLSITESGILKSPSITVSLQLCVLLYIFWYSVFGVQMVLTVISYCCITPFINMY